jgi:hypothetical protein
MSTTIGGSSLISQVSGKQPNPADDEAIADDRTGMTIRGGIAASTKLAGSSQNFASGPRTEADKARSRMNALRHGLASTPNVPADAEDRDVTAMCDRLMLIESEAVSFCRDIEEALAASRDQDAAQILRRLWTATLSVHTPNCERRDARN